MMAASSMLSAVIVLLWLCATASILYLLVLLAAAALPPKKRTAEVGSNHVQTLAVIIPAHDEEPVLAATLHSLAAQTYPHSQYEVIVVADNCSDATAEIARSLGATVLERHNNELRGKGHALDWALKQLLSGPNPAEAFVIVDADTWVAPDFLQTMASRLPRDGFGALQGRYGVLNADAGWRASLMSAAFDLVNHVKPLGRARLGLGVGLKGNGMAFTQALLRAAPWRGDSITEDLDYALELARRHGVAVEYVPEAVVRAQMPTTGGQAATQRSRWERGRYRLLRECCLPLITEGVRRRNPHLCDAAVDLILPPLAELGALLVVCVLLVAAGMHRHLLLHPHLWQAAVTGTGLGLLVYVTGGLRVSGAPQTVYLALLRAPLYAVWKFGLYGVNLLQPRRASTEWVRTERAPMTVVEPEGKRP